jgi:hypothetical protein
VNTPGPPAQQIEEPVRRDRLRLPDRAPPAMEPGVQPRIAKRGVPHGSGLGTVRRVVERAFAWLHGMRRLRTRYERRADIHEAFLNLGICRCADSRRSSSRPARPLPSRRGRSRCSRRGHRQHRPCPPPPGRARPGPDAAPGGRRIRRRRPDPGRAAGTRYRSGRPAQPGRSGVARGDDQVLRAPGDGQVAVLAQFAQVARAQPAVVEGARWPARRANGRGSDRAPRRRGPRTRACRRRPCLMMDTGIAVRRPRWRVWDWR